MRRERIMHKKQRTRKEKVSHSQRLVVGYKIWKYSKKYKLNHFVAVVTKYNFKKVKDCVASG
jgi:hypothetical protein